MLRFNFTTSGSIVAQQHTDFRYGMHQNRFIISIGI